MIKRIKDSAGVEHEIDYNSLANKPNLFSGSYEDLSDKPSLFSGSYNDLTDKPSLFSGSYNDLTDVPTASASNVVVLNLDTSGYELTVNDILILINEYATANSVSYATYAIKTTSNLSIDEFYYETMGTGYFVYSRVRNKIYVNEAFNDYSMNLATFIYKHVPIDITHKTYSGSLTAGGQNAFDVSECFIIHITGTFTAGWLSIRNLNYQQGFLHVNITEDRYINIAVKFTKIGEGYYTVDTYGFDDTVISEVNDLMVNPNNMGSPTPLTKLYFEEADIPSTDYTIEIINNV